MPQHIEENLWNSCGLYWQSFGKRSFKALTYISSKLDKTQPKILWFQYLNKEKDMV